MTLKRIVQFLVFVLAGAGLFLFFNVRNDLYIYQQLAQIADEVVEKVKPKENPNPDIPLQMPLESPPEIVKAIYSTGWSAGSTKRVNYFIDLIKKTELNAIVIDIKDYSGTLSYDTDIESVDEYGAEEVKIARPNALIKKFHDEGIYVIARQTVFQDPILATARPDLALTSSSTGKQWTDYKGIMWIDAAAKEAWDYNIEIAKDALARGFDEINFDYIRFASDGNMDDIIYPFWDQGVLRRQIMRDFFKYLRQNLPGAKISADLFGYTTLLWDDLGIGQNIDDAFHYFDAIAPMVYPSHYNEGFDGYQNPAEHPYEVVYRSLLEADERLKHYMINAEYSTSTEKYLVKEPQLRPWLQDFDLGAKYDAVKVRAQMNAVYAAMGLCDFVATSTEIGAKQKCNSQSGWMLWDSSNIYTREALQLSD